MGSLCRTLDCWLTPHSRAIADKSNEVLEPLVSHFSKLLANYAQRSHLSLDERLLRHLVQQLPRSPYVELPRRSPS